MFKFIKFSELTKYHKTYVKYKRKSQQLATKSIDKDSKSASCKLKKILAERKEFDIEYGKKIYDILIGIKPNFLNERTNQFESWDEVIGGVFKDNEIFECLVCTVEEDGGIYRFPPEYYD